jgi:cytochrome P450
MLPFVLERQSGKGDDYISMIWRDGEQIWGEQFDVDDVLTAATFVFAAGSETTAAGVANGLYLLLSQPELQERVRGGGERAVKHLVEETLRLVGPVEYRPRRAKRDVTVGHVQIRKGEQVFALTACANRDPAHYERPNEVDIDRRSPRDHFAFFVGPRTCPGQNFARLQMEVVLSAALERLRNLRLDPSGPPPQFAGMLLRRWEPLHALFTGTARAT